MISPIPVSPLSLNQLTRDYWGQYDAAVCAQLAQLANDPCYQIKFYKAPADDQEVFVRDAYGYVTYGMRITPGSIIFGFYLPMIVDTDNVLDSAPNSFTVQITDVSLEHKFWDEPVSSIFLSNFKPTYQSDASTNMGSFPNLMVTPHPVVGSGQFDIEIQSTSGDIPDPDAPDDERIQLVIGVLEVCGVS